MVTFRMRCRFYGIVFVMVIVGVAPVSARFISVDPMASKFPSMSPYAYANNNPIKNFDPDGRETQVYSLPIGSNGINTGDKHLFIRVKNDNLGLNTTRGFYPKNRLAAVANSISPFINIQSGNEIVAKTDLSSELGAVLSQDQGGASNATLEATIAPPDGMSTDQYDQTVLSTVDNLSTENIDYNLGGPNSNTMVDNVIETTGAKMPSIKGATAQNYGEKEKPPNRQGPPPRAYE